MKITTFSNMTGLIHGTDPKRIGCDQGGVLTIGSTEVSISPESDSIFPLLAHGGTGNYEAAFLTKDGRFYDLGVVEVRNGRVTPPPPTAVEIMDLRLRADAAERKCAELLEEVRNLAKIFDTNSLNFLIK